MRFALPLTLVFATFVAAAPVPGTEQAEKRKLEALWKELDAPDPVVRVRAAFALLDEPNAVAFLKEKLPPVEASKEQITGWLKELDSDDEKEWRAAFERLRYFDPRLALTPAEQLEVVTTDNGRRVLFGLWYGALFWFGEPNTYRTELELSVAAQNRVMAKLTCHVQRNGRKSTSSMSAPVEPLDRVQSPAWDRAELAANILRRIDTKASRAALERLATGHDEAKPTRVAAQLLKASGAKSEKTAPDECWGKLLLPGDPAGIEAVCGLIDSPESAKRLKAGLPAVKASKEQMAEWLKALDSEDPKVWKPAFEKMLYFRPRITLDWQEQIDAVTTAQGRTALFRLWHNPPAAAPDGLDVDPGCTLGISEQADVRWLVLEAPPGNGGQNLRRVQLRPLDTMPSPHWQRARIAIIALERMKTDEAKAVLKQLADGHPDILPTKEAKAALERMK